ncbi:MAG TPA: ATP-binding protein [Thermoanaerobaculia bacterium]|nr:ATP-binding protein [Thermoanaerobaculia bacterium]
MAKGSKGPLGEASEKIYSRLEALEIQAISPRAVRAQQFAEVIQSLRSALDEVEAVETELAQQNEELLTAREALEIERHRYKDLFELAPDGFVVTDDRGVIQEANRAAAELLRIHPHALAGKPLMVYVGMPERGRYRDCLAKLRTGERLHEVEISLVCRQGASRQTLITAVREEEKPGRPPRLFWVLRDISARRAAEAALRESEERLRHSQRLESIGRLAGGIAHSFNNLLAAIGFHSELMLEELPEEATSARHHAEEILKAGERAAVLARQLLAFGRKQVLQPRVLRLNQVIADMEPMLRRLLGEHILLCVDLDPEVGTLCADLGQLEQVILNLAVNARDAMPDGGRLTVATSVRTLSTQDTWGGEDLPAGPYVVLTVADTGAGMTEEVRTRLFEPFFTTKDRDKGTGLGLSTVYGIVRQTGGAIQVESAPRQGSRFTVLLPGAEMADSCELPEGPRRLGSRDESRGTEVVLVVEDEDNIREPIVEVLESRGYQVLAARDGSEALAVAQDHDGAIRLLITDVIMPGMSGGQLAEQLEQNLPDLRVLYISGYPEDSVAHHRVLEPGRSFLQKPFPPSELLLTVRGILDT